MQWQVLLKEGGLALFCYLIFSRFIIFTFKKYCKIELYISRKKIFFGQHNFIKKSHLKLSKNKPACMCKEGWCVRLGQEGVFYVRLEELSEIP